jgi:hypothetical protein
MIKSILAPRALLFFGMIGVIFCHTASMAEPNPSVSTLTVRPATDGTGPSHLLAVGPYILVVDPLKAQILRYSPNDFRDGPKSTQTCAFRRDFSPWQSIPIAGGVWLIDETEARAMFLSTADVAAMSGQDCPAPVKRDRVATVPRSFDRSSDWGVVTLANPSGPGVLRVGTKSTGTILNARLLRTLADGRSVVFWTRLASLPRWDKPQDHAENYDTQGRVVVGLFVTVFDRNGQPVSTNRIRDLSMPKQASGTYASTFQGMTKRGFEYIAVREDASLYGLTSESGNFVVKRFASPSNPSGEVISLQGDESVKDNEGLVDAAGGGPGPDSDIQGASDWREALQSAAANYIKAKWWIPKGGMAAPCGGADECDLMFKDGKFVRLDPRAVAAGSAKSVTQTGDEGPRWKRPRYLIGAHDGDPEVGVPYSYGGQTTPGALKVIASDPAVRPNATYNSTPLGHIVEKLSVDWVNVDAAAYPIGTDCSRFVSEILAAIDETSDFVPEDGRKFTPQSEFYGVPVEDPNDLKAGDIFIKHGHVVIFAGTYYIGHPGRAGVVAGQAHSAIGYVVYEASSRCGRVCRSIYPLEYFNGWWMLRPKRMRSADLPSPYGEPKWKSRETPISYAQ